MSGDTYQYALELLRQDGSLIAQVPVDVDWEPAREWTRLEVLRHGGATPLLFPPTREDARGVPPDAADARQVFRIEPLWHSTRQQPYVSGFRVTANGHSCDFTTRYLYSVAQRMGTHLVTTGVLTSGEKFLYRVLAYPCESAASGPAALTVEEVPTQPHISPGSLADFTSGCVALGPISDQDVPVFVPRGVLDEISDTRLRAGSNETGGVLIGHLRRDPSIPELYVEVTAQIPARYTESQTTRLTFTPDTWADVRGAMDLRGAGEILAGWWHYHPTRAWCSSEAQCENGCKSQADFFSADDCALHRTVFAPAYCVGLVTSDRRCAGDAWAASYAMFGWRQGSIVHRGFYLADRPGLLGGREDASRI